MPPTKVSQAEFENYRDNITGDTEGARNMTALFEDASNVTSNPTYWNALQTPGGLSKEFLESLAPLLGDEAANMARWPAGQLEELRVKLCDAVNANQKVIFYSFLYGGGTENILYTYAPLGDPSGDLVVNLLSPETNLQVDGGLYTIVVNP